MAATMEAQADEARRVQVVSVSGSLDREGSRRLADLLFHVTGGENWRIEVDLQENATIDSAAAVGLLVAAEAEARQRGGFLRVTRPSPQAAEMLRLVRLDEKLVGGANG